MDRLAALQVFARVVETGSFSRAAADLGLGQPAVTKAVAALERRLGVRLLHRTTRGVTPTEAGLLFHERCKAITHAVAEAEDVAALQQADASGVLRVSASVAFGRRVLVPLALAWMREHPRVQVDLLFDDRYVNLVEQGIDVAVRMGRLADSTLGAQWLGTNPWLLAAAPAYLARRGRPESPADLAAHDALVYSSVQGDSRWSFTAPDGREQVVPVKGPLRSNNLSALLAACEAGFGVAALPWYVAGDAVAAGRLVAVLEPFALPSQAMHAVFPSPRLVPRKVTGFIAALAQALEGEWWRPRPREPAR